jgi:acetyl esterase/lipase
VKHLLVTLHVFSAPSRLFSWMRLYQTSARPDRSLQGEWIAPRGTSPLSGAVILYLRGGRGYLRSILTHCTIRRLSATTNSQVFALDCRLPPGDPRALEGCIEAYLTLCKRGVPPSSIVVASNVSGCGLVTAQLTAFREFVESHSSE